LDDEFGAGLQDRADDLDEEESEDADEEEDGRSLAENHRQALRGGMILCRAHGRSPSISSTVQTLWAVGPGYSSKRSMLSQIEGRSMGIGPAHRVSAPRLPAGTHQTGFVGEDDEGGAIASVEAGEQSAGIGACRGRAEEQLGGDLGIGQAPADAAEHLDLPFAQPQIGRASCRVMWYNHG